RAMDAERAGAVAVATGPELVPVRDRARALMDAAGGWFGVAQQGGPAELEGGARRFALAVGRSLQLALVAEHAQWLLGRGDRSGLAVARQLVALSPVPDGGGAPATDEARSAARLGG